MDRRRFLTTLPAPLAASQASSTGPPEVIELTWVYLRNSAEQQANRARKFWAEAMAPAMRRAGAGVVGLLSPVIAPATPSILVVASYPSLARWEEACTKLEEDKDLLKALEAYHTGTGFEYQRMERWLLRAFKSFPKIMPPERPQSGSHVFELRTYESENTLTLARKVHQFDHGEIEIFRKVGIRPVFFGYALAGPHIPHLTYLVVFDSLAHRDEAWTRFRQDPDWEKLRTNPAYTDPGLVTNITNAIFNSIPGSDIV